MYRNSRPSPVAPQQQQQRNSGGGGGGGVDAEYDYSVEGYDGGEIVDFDNDDNNYSDGHMTNNNNNTMSHNTTTPTSASAYGVEQNRSYATTSTTGHLHQYPAAMASRTQNINDYTVEDDDDDDNLYYDNNQYVANDDRALQQQQPQQQQRHHQFSDSPQHQVAADDDDEDDFSPTDNNNRTAHYGTTTTTATDHDDALLDLAQLEELHTEAERMKAVGNKHMAAQEYIPAYNAYSAALQLCPVGPSSHVFLSNRAAALLSLKRYPAAATDARRAVALAPTFGKAHARLGQALYFMKEYGPAVDAYQDAVQYEPDNAVTAAYLAKALAKLEKQQARHTTNTTAGGTPSNNNNNVSSNVSVLTGESSTLFSQPTTGMSVATDPANQYSILRAPYASHDDAVRTALIQATLRDDSVEQKRPDSNNNSHGAALPVSSSSSRNDTKMTRNDNAKTVAPPANEEENVDDDDPEFYEALRIQQRANSFLVAKQYRQAIEEYTAALFLVPDDVQLSSDLHLGRAHALNGSRRHESARNDAVLALKLSPNSPAAYSTLAKSLFYLRDYAGAIEAFGSCQDLLPPGEQLGLFDQAYLEKAERFLLEADASLPTSRGKPTGNNNNMSAASSVSTASSVPKLAPPRFVPREEAILMQTTMSTAPARRMPKEWPQQFSPSNNNNSYSSNNSSNRSTHVPLKVGPEHDVVCLTEALGIKLNRGADGIVRVLSVTDDGSTSTSRTTATNVLRKGTIQVGDIIREAAGVDMRRPMTNIMWGDTVALIKMAPRPIVLVVATELSPVPAMAMQKEQRQGQSFRGVERPSPASDDRQVGQLYKGGLTEGDPAPSEDGTYVSADKEDTPSEATSSAMDDALASLELGVKPPVEESKTQTGTTNAIAVENIDKEQIDPGDFDDDIVEMEDEPPVKPKSLKVSASPSLETVTETVDEEKSYSPSSTDIGQISSSDEVEVGDAGENAYDDNDDGIESVEDESEDTPRDKTAKQLKTKPREHESNEGDESAWDRQPQSLRDEEEKVVEGEVLFLRDSPPAYGGWDTLRWMSYNGARKVNFSQPVYRLESGIKKRKGLPMFWKTGGSHYENRSMIVYDEPNLILIVRRPGSLEEIRMLLGLPVSDEANTSADDTDWALNPDTALQSYWILESLVDPSTSKLRLSPLTTATSVATEGADERERSCFQLLTPTESMSLSAVNVRSESKKREQSFTDSGAFLETLSVETAIAQVLCASHNQGSELGNSETDIAWKHQIIIGSLHALVLSGSPKQLQDGIAHARMTSSRGTSEGTSEGKFLASRIVDAVDNNGFPALYYACTHKMEAAVRILVNAGADVSFRTGLHGLSMIHVSARNLDDKSLSTLLSVRSPVAADANILDNKGRTPIYVAMVEGSVLDRGKDPSSLGRCITALKACGGTMITPLSPVNLRNPVGALAYMWLAEYLFVVLKHVPHRFPADEMSIGAMFQYPVHSALVTLRKHLRKGVTDDRMPPEGNLIRTLETLCDRGFEPNERLDVRAFGTERTMFDEFVGYSPLQVVALIALEFESIASDCDGAFTASNKQLIGNVAECLVSRGARLSIEPPMTYRLRSKVSDPAPEETSFHRIEVLTKKLDADKQLMLLLGGEDKLNHARKLWMEMKKVATATNKSLIDESSNIENSGVAGGSDVASCAICWSVFGSLMNRKHKCRASNRYVCDECSTKRLVIVTSEFRLSDGQFSAARADAVREQKERERDTMERVRIRSQQTEQARATVRMERLEAEEAADRDSLFGGMLEAATTFVMGGEDSRDALNANALGGLTSSLDQTRDALNQRGEQLAALNDKSAKMVDESANFSKMATELRKQSEKGFFW